METKLEDIDIAKHVLDLGDYPLVSDDGKTVHPVATVVEADECVRRYISTFGTKLKREEYEHDYIKAFPNEWQAMSPGCPENCSCRH